MSDLIHAHVHSAALIIGGAPSWLDEYHDVTSSWDVITSYITLSANDHGAKRVPCDYIVACDDLEARLRPYNIPILSKYTWADYRIYEMPLPNSALMASWAAWIMGCSPIIICGVECFQGKTYLDNPKADSSGKRLPLKEHLKRWARLKDFAPDGQFRPVGGILCDLFPKYDPTEVTGLGSTEQDKLNMCKGAMVHFTRSTEVGLRHYERGETAEVDKFEAHRLYREKRAERAI